MAERQALPCQELNTARTCGGVFLSTASGICVQVVRVFMYYIRTCVYAGMISLTSERLKWGSFVLNESLLRFVVSAILVCRSDIAYVPVSV